MNHREQLIEKAYRALHQFSACGCNPDDGDEHPMDRHIATEMVDALLPQVTTIEELEALPKALLITTPAVGFPPAPLWWLGGELWFVNLRTVTEEEFRNYLRCGPLTVVWQP